MTIDRRNVRALVRAIAYDRKGSRLGRVAQVFLDDRTDEPAWVAVDVTRTRGMRLLPLAGAGLKGRYLVIRAERTTVRSAPRIDLGDGQLSSQDESLLLEHYGLAPARTDETAQQGEHRPASPWSDDTERETAWERPAQQQDFGGPNDLSHGWEQRIEDRADTSSGVGAGIAASVGPGTGTFEQRDTAPPATIPPPSAEPAKAGAATKTATNPAWTAPAAAAARTPTPPPASGAPPAQPPTAPAQATSESTPDAAAASPTASSAPAAPAARPSTEGDSRPPAPREQPRPDAGSTATGS